MINRSEHSLVIGTTTQCQSFNKCVISDKYRNLGKISLSPKRLKSTHTNESSEHGDVTSPRDTLEYDKQKTK